MMKRIAFVLFSVLFLFEGAYAQTMREATKVVAGQTNHFTIDKDEQKDFLVRFGSGEYYLVMDVKRLDDRTTAIMSLTTQLLKSNGTMLDPSFFSVNQLDLAARAGKRFRSPFPMTARLRMHNNDSPLEVWMTILPAAKMKWLPFAFYSEPMKPLGIGADAGKGGTLDAHGTAYHEIKLSPGKWTFWLYLKRPDGRDSNLMGDLDQYDQYGFPVGHLVTVNELGVEARQEKQIYLLKPQTVIVRVTNNDNVPVDYIIGVGKTEE